MRSKSEAGYTKVRKRFTLAKDSRGLNWNFISNSDFNTLRTFFEDNQGGSFYWTDPYTFETREYYFLDDELNWEETAPGFKSVELNIEEI